MEKKYADTSDITNPPEKSSYQNASPYPNEDVSFNWLSIDYPYSHCHDYFELFIVTSGSFIHHINDEVHVLNVGDACLIRPKDFHKILDNKRSNSCHLVILFTIDYAKKLFSLYDENFYDKIVNSTSSLHFTTSNYPITKIIDTVLALSNNEMSLKEKSMKTKILITAILSDFFEQRTMSIQYFPQWFSEFLITLSNPSLKMSVQELSLQTSYSYSRLSRIFKSYMDMSIVDYITNNKLHHACQLLANTKLSVLEISNKLAYDSISYFNKIFKQHFDMTPSEYRRQSHSKNGTEQS